jgi:hypothetical protein
VGDEAGAAIAAVPAVAAVGAVVAVSIPRDAAKKTPRGTLPKVFETRVFHVAGMQVSDLRRL